ncbi:hypothetical protein CTheo_1425 [Ceratobasidium theobromae]|uniref:Succinate dehydrogenase assembly factor 4, mitochondrial n=1 Tax=Ceratobasidium theobromae TaxID=1582974 RepID=A0A5N5QVB1_9AGAM|nr:hypothetical protein CTheo_1425 [Ceratobasidium theobromae]
MQPLVNLRTVSRTKYFRGLRMYAPQYSSRLPYARPGPPPLPKEEQREFEELVRKAQTPVTSANSTASVIPGDELHPDARQPITSEFTGDVNPITGEQGGPKQEPVPQGRSDWSYGGRVTDF